jgi:SHS2 domain-containing protein
LRLDNSASNITSYRYKQRLDVCIRDVVYSLLAFTNSTASALIDSIIVQHDYCNIKPPWDIYQLQEEIMPSGSSRSHLQIAFEEIEHTADRALKIYGRNFEELLRNAAFGLNSLMGVNEETGATTQIKSIILDAEDAEGLLVEWLSELAYWAESEMLVFTKFDLKKVSPTHVKAAVAGRQVSKLERHIKAVTYHKLEIVKTDTGLAATVVFDV